MTHATAVHRIDRLAGRGRGVYIAAMNRLWVIAAVAVGGAAGALARYGLSRWIHRSAAGGFPWGTFAANVIGCLLIGFCFQWLGQRGNPVLRSGVMVGFIGALTTFSTYCLETRNLADERQLLAAGVNIVASVIAGLIAVYLGIVAAKWTFGTT